MAQFYWSCPWCDALNSSEENPCWNCGTPYPRGSRQREECRADVVDAVCNTCRRPYKSITHPRFPGGTPCPYYFEHHEPGAYYSPVMPPMYWLDVNDLVWDDVRMKTVPIKEEG